MRGLSRRVRVSINSAIEQLERRALLDGNPPGIHAPMDELSGGYLSRPLAQRYDADLSNSNPASGPDAPALGTTFGSMDFDSQAALTGFYRIPPDNSGAAGFDQVVAVVNSAMRVQSKTGVDQWSANLSAGGGGFFSSLSPVSTFDPKVIYDQHNGRYVMVILDQTSAPQMSRMLIAVSKDNHPDNQSDWWIAQINSIVNIGGQNCWADFPGIAVDANNVYLTNNMARFSDNVVVGSRLWILPKANFYAGIAIAPPPVYDFGTSAGLPSAPPTTMPTQVYGTAPGTVGTWLISSGWVSGATDFLSVIRVDNPAAPSFVNTFVSLGDSDNAAAAMPDMPQSGSGVLIDTGDRRVHNAVWRNNNLYTANTVVPPSGADLGQATVRWYRMGATAVSTALADQGNIGGNDIVANAYTCFPGVAVDSAGNMAVSFSASAATIFAGAYYTGRLSTDPAGTMQSSGTLRAGQDVYIRTFGGPRNRWGDYSTASVDPTNDSTFWLFNQYAMTQGTPISGESGRWATQWGSFTFQAPPPVPSIPDLTTDSGSNPADNITNDNTPTFIGTAQAGSTVNILFNGISRGSAVADGGGNYSVTCSPAVADGVNYTVTATATNGAGTSLPSGPILVTIDTVAPTVGVMTFLFETSNAVTWPFSEDVSASLSGTSNALFNTTTASVPPNGQALSYNGGTNVATWTYLGILPNGNYTATLIGPNIQDVAGNLLTPPAAAPFFFLNGDATRDKSVGGPDFNILATNFGTTGKTFTQGNFDYDPAGNVNGADFNILATNFGVTLPGGGADDALRPGGGTGEIFGDRKIGSGGNASGDDKDDLLA